MSKYINVDFEGEFKIKKKGWGNCVLCGEFTYLDPHHTITQSRGGSDEDIVDLCRRCHDWVGTHPQEASKLGLYIRGYKYEQTDQIR